MRIVVLGGHGAVGAQVVDYLSAQDVTVVCASRRTGVDVITGVGLSEAFLSAKVVVDVTNSPQFDGVSAGAFFQQATRNVLDFAADAGVGHLVSLSIVGAARLASNGYFAAKLAQEQMIRASLVPHTIIRSTQFFEFLDAIIADAERDGVIRLAPARVQPIAAQDVASALADVALRPPSNGIVEVAGPDAFALDRLASQYLAARSDTREIVVDPQALYFGTRLTDETLITDGLPRFGHTEFDRWIRNGARLS